MRGGHKREWLSAPSAQNVLLGRPLKVVDLAWISVALKHAPKRHGFGPRLRNSRVGPLLSNGLISEHVIRPKTGRASRKIHIFSFSQVMMWRLWLNSGPDRALQGRREPSQFTVSRKRVNLAFDSLELLGEKVVWFSLEWTR
jgi:hypothetical protein